MGTLKKALGILEVFLKIEDDNISVSELARLSGLNRATVNRNVSDLVDRGYLNQPKKRGKYYLGAKFIRFHQLIMQKRKLELVAGPNLAKLAESVRDCIALSVQDGEESLVIAVIDSQHALRIALEVGVRTPLYCTGQGKAILAGMTEAELDGYLNKVNLKQFTENTITDPNKLKSHIRIAAMEGVAYDDEEETLGINNVAASILNTDGKVIAAVGVIGPSIRLTRVRMREIAPLVKQCAEDISRSLGYIPYDTKQMVSQPQAKNQR
jgi:DNA-binding IclR family transcriptional regulator